MHQQLTISTWQKDQESYLSQMAGKTIYMLYSGGKDSALALYYLARQQKTYQFNIEAHASIFPPHRYAQKEQAALSQFWQRHGVPLTWHAAPGTEKALARATNACRPCQQIRKRWLKQLVANTDIPLNRLVLAVGFSLWDLASYAMEATADRWNTGTDTGKTNPSRRFLETSQRFYPLLKMSDGYWVYRPMIQYTSPAIKAAIRRHRIPLTTIGCQWSSHRPKRGLDNFFDQCGQEFDYKQLLAFVTDVLALPAESMCTKLSGTNYLEEHF